jgi:predicted O-linked N-acetylglucosamine transferase (SPINDLY family)
MAGALLTALNLPELITYNLHDYEERAVQLAEQPALLADLKRRLVEGRQTSPLFDMPRFVKDFEEALASKVLRPGAG